MENSYALLHRSELKRLVARCSNLFVFRFACLKCDLKKPSREGEAQPPRRQVTWKKGHTSCGTNRWHFQTLVSDSSSPPFTFYFFWHRSVWRSSMFWDDSKNYSYQIRHSAFDIRHVAFDSPISMSFPGFQFKEIWTSNFKLFTFHSTIACQRVDIPLRFAGVFMYFLNLSG